MLHPRAAPHRVPRRPRSWPGSTSCIITSLARTIPSTSATAGSLRSLSKLLGPCQRRDPPLIGAAAESCGCDWRHAGGGPPGCNPCGPSRHTSPPVSPCRSWDGSGSPCHCCACAGGILWGSYALHASLSPVADCRSRLLLLPRLRLLSWPLNFFGIQLYWRPRLRPSPKKRGSGDRDHDRDCRHGGRNREKAHSTRK